MTILCILTCVCTPTYICRGIYIHTCMWVYVHICMCICTLLKITTYIYMYRHTQVCLSVRQCTGVCGSTRGCWAGDWGGAGTVTTAGTPRTPIPTSTAALTPRPHPPGSCDILPFRKDLLKHREQKPGHMEHKENAGASLTAAASSGKGPPLRHSQCHHT